MRPSLLALLLLLTTTLSRAQVGQQTAPRPRLVVVGFARDVDLQAWRDARIGRGLATALADTLYGSGVFRLLEENDEVRTTLRAIGERLWAGERTERPAVDSEVAARVTALHPDVTASGRILRFEAPGSRMSVGPFQRAQRTFIVEVEVSLREIASDRTFTARAAAEANRVAVSAIFSVKNDKVLFDDTAVGKATTDALQKAVAKVLDAYGSSRDR